MATSWFITPVNRRDVAGRATIYIAMDDFTEQIRADSGDWNGIYVGPLHNRALCKVKASSSTLAAIAATPDYLRIPIANLDTTLASLTSAQRTAIRSALANMGYRAADVTATFPSLGAVTLRQVLRFIASERSAIRYDVATDSYIADGPSAPADPPEAVDEMVG